MTWVHTSTEKFGSVITAAASTSSQRSGISHGRLACASHIATSTATSRNPYVTRRPGWAMLSIGIEDSSPHGSIEPGNPGIWSPSENARITRNPANTAQVARRRLSVIRNARITRISGTPRYQGLSPHWWLNWPQKMLNRPGVR